MYKPFLTGIALAAFAAAAFAQQSAPPADPTFGETIEVRVINVDVVVTDGKGKPVTGLTKDDFDLFENGKKRVITNFLEMNERPITRSGSQARTADATAPAAAGEAPADTRSRKIVFFIDNTTAAGFDRNRALEPVRKFLGDVMRAGDQVMIVSWDPGLRVRLDFTSDVAAANAAVAELAGSVGTGTNANLERRRVMDEILAWTDEWNTDKTGMKPSIDLAVAPARAYATKLQREQHQVAEALRSVMLAMRGVEGRKALVFLTGRLDENPGTQIFEFIDGVKEKFAGWRDFNYRTEANDFHDAQLVPQLTAAANSSGISIYPIHSAGLAFDSDFMNAENSGTYGATTKPTNSSTGSTVVTMSVLAAETGGSALVGSNNFQLALDTVANDLTSYYSLGFRTDERRTDSVRKLDVRLKNGRGYRVRMRHEFVEKSLMTEINEAVAANLAYPVARNELGINAVVGASEAAADNHLTLPLDIKVPTSTLTLVPDGTDLVGRFSTFIAFGRGDGTVSKVVRQEQNLRIPADSLKRRKEVTVRTVLTVDQKTEGVSVAVLDEMSHLTGFATVKLLASATTKSNPEKGD